MESCTNCGRDTSRKSCEHCGYSDFDTADYAGFPRRIVERVNRERLDDIRADFNALLSAVSD